MPQIAVYPNEILRTPCTLVEHDSNVSDCVTLLLETYNALQPGCLGVAANQVGIPLRIIVLRVNDTPRTIINPRIIERDTHHVVAREYCYSLPGVSRSVEASDKIKIDYLDESWEPHKIELSDLEARAFQHELHHLDGELIIDIGLEPASQSKSKLKRIARVYRNGWRHV